MVLFQVKGAQEQSLRLKVRQHVNPLSSKYQVPTTLPADWIQQAFDNISRPLIVDIGCAKGLQNLE